MSAAKPMIEVRRVSKQYQLGVFGMTSLKEELSRVWSRTPRGSAEPFCALKDVTFDVDRGEVLGIIGRNGAGKSTLLKILSRITQQTTGEITLRGRVASLLEVGTGFHPDLTGRENVFLNGAILGMTRAEIRRKFDAIVAFAEIEPFIDTPVKRYSSGMYVRLAFAVAAHLDPEILIVDEVLAVGDVSFQQKCLDRMENVARSGRTVLFVSHNLTAIQALCDRTLLLDGGILADTGPPAAMVRRYLDALRTVQETPLAERTDRAGDGRVRLIDVRIESAEPDRIIRCTSRLRITLCYRAESALRSPAFAIGIYDESSIGIYGLDSSGDRAFPATLPKEGSVTVLTEEINLTPGRCFVNVAATLSGMMADYVPHAAAFEIVGPNDAMARVPTRDWVVGVLGHEWSHAIH